MEETLTAPWSMLSNGIPVGMVTGLIIVGILVLAGQWWIATGHR